MSIDAYLRDRFEPASLKKAATAALALGVGAAIALGIVLRAHRRGDRGADVAPRRPPRALPVIKQLSSLDTQYLALEGPRHTGHFATLGIYDPSTAPNRMLTAASMVELLGERMHLLSPLRWRLAAVPLGLDYPYLVPDQHCDLSYHVREAALTEPGDDRQLAALVARLHSRPLDRTRPLWEMYVISGLASGRVAIYIKLHHAVADGLSGTEMLGALLDVDPQQEPDRPPDLTEPQRHPSRRQMWGLGLSGVSRHPARMLGSAPRVLPNLEETSLAGVPGAARLGRLAGRAGALGKGNGNRVLPPVLKAPKTSFNARISPHRCCAFGQIDLARVKQVKQAHQVTVNDVVVSMCAGAVRRWLHDHDELLNEPLIAQIPVSSRSDEHAGTYGNRIQTLAVPLHTQIANPVLRLQQTAASLLQMKERNSALPRGLLVDANHLVPPFLATQAVRATFALATSALGRPTWNLVVSNVPGPQLPLYCRGARLVALYPLSLITDGMGLNITVLSYDGRLDIGIVADREQMPDVWTLLDGLESSLSELEHAKPAVA